MTTYKTANGTPMSAQDIAARQKAHNRHEATRKGLITRADNRLLEIPHDRERRSVAFYVATFDRENHLMECQYVRPLADMKAHPYYVERDLPVEHDVVATASPDIAAFIDPTGALRRSGLLLEQSC